MKKGRSEAPRGMLFEVIFGASWETICERWRFLELLCFVCFLGTEKGTATSAMGAGNGGVGPFN